MPHDFTVLTYNLHKGFSAANRRFVLGRMKEALEEQNCDLLLLQETQGEHQRHALRHANWPSDGQCRFLADSLWPHHAYGKNAIYAAGHHGNAILSKYPIVLWENINVSPFKRASRSVLHAVIELPSTLPKLHVICLHFGLLPKERQSQLQQLVKRISEHVEPNEPLIIGGDFNDWRNVASTTISETLAVAEASQACNGVQARTYPALYPLLALDRIFFRGLSAERCLALSNPPWPQLSDHLPLRAEFSFA